MNRGSVRRAGLAAGALVLLGLGLTHYARLQISAPPLSDAQVESQPVSKADVTPLAQAIAAAWRQEPVDPSTLPARLQDRNQGVYLGARRGGHLVTETWATDGATVWDGILIALDAIRADVPASPPDTLQLDLIHSVRHHSYPEDKEWLLTDLFRGVRGLAVQTKGGTHRLSPSSAIAQNMGNEAFIDASALFPAWLAGGQEHQRSLHRYASFGADQFLIRLRPEIKGIALQRGTLLVPPEAVSSDAVNHMVSMMAQWLKHTQQSSGRVTYLYRPSEAERESSRDNMIRRWMASAALVRWARHTAADADWDAATQSIEHNLQVYYSEEDNLGIIRWQGMVKLGALAIAAYTLHTHRDADRWRAQELALRRTIESLVDEDGSIRSWHSTPDDNAAERPNFYPGEALFYWAQIIADGDAPELLDAYMKSFQYYRSWHLEERNRHPSFVPWHTQAHFQIWQQTKDPELAQFILEMNDWLVDIQQWEAAAFLDTRGHFYKAGRNFGTGHSSATGVYIEGLIDAWRLAKAMGDEDRAETYRVTMLRASRSIMQTQFLNETEAFYVEDKSMVMGGVRSRVWDNEIRCDNVQHAMMGMLKMLQHMPASDLVLVRD